MADEYDVRSKRVTGTGALVIGRARIRQVVATVSAAGRITLTDGNGGATLVDLDFQGAGTYDIFFPGTGILSANDPHVSLATNVTAATVFWS
jgi:hypothetical protein